MKKKHWIFTALALFTLIVILAFAFWDGEEENGTLTLYGNIDIRQADLGFRVFGRLKTLYAEEGDVIKKGDLLAELDDTPYVYSLHEAQAKVASINQSMDFASLQLKRRNALLDGNSVSKEDYQQAFFNKKTLRANLKEAQAALMNAKVSLEDTKLLAPSDGVIYTRIREPGTVLDKGQPVFSLAVNTPIWARAYVSEPNLGKIYPGMEAKIYTDTKKNPTYKGHIGFISPIAEFTPKSVESTDLRTNLVYQIRVIIDNPDNGLRQGMPVTVALEWKEGKKA